MSAIYLTMNVKGRNFLFEKGRSRVGFGYLMELFLKNIAYLRKNALMFVPVA
jgi:hypothetical protein